jgi:hypothetical protein
MSNAGTSKEAMKEARGKEGIDHASAEVQPCGLLFFWKQAERTPSKTQEA